MTNETLSQIYNALYERMGSDLKEWILREHPSGDQMREKLRELKEAESQRDRGVLRRVITGFFN